MGLANYIEKDGWFMIVFGDTNALASDGSVVNATDGDGQAGNPDQGVAVCVPTRTSAVCICGLRTGSGGRVRAKISEVVAAAKQHKTVPWKKLYNGQFTEPALASATNESGGRFTPLNLRSQGYMHGDAAFIEPLGQWCIVVMSGGRIRQTEAWRKSILIAFSPDGLSWSCVPCTRTDPWRG